MITKRQLADLVRDDKSGGNPSDESKYQYQSIFKKIEIARNELIMRNFFEHRNENSYDINGDFISSFCVDIKCDEKRDEFFSTLPEGLISLPDNRGLRQVSEVQNQLHPFIRIVNGAQGVFASLEAGGLGGRTGYYLEGDRIYYQDISEQVEQVLIKMIASVDDLGEDEPLPVPAEFEKALYDLVKEMMQEKKETTEDKYNDSNNQQI